ncbi:hypothetical protein H4R99_006658 [Coemansia sp. RSA 1722]|nr:hypothetical protein H4R99_006658 [Coemansia sp. RSA 1722]
MTSGTRRSLSPLSLPRNSSSPSIPVSNNANFSADAPSARQSQSTSPLFASFSAFSTEPEASPNSNTISLSTRGSITNRPTQPPRALSPRNSQPLAQGNSEFELVPLNRNKHHALSNKSSSTHSQHVVPDMKGGRYTDGVVTAADGNSRRDSIVRRPGSSDTDSRVPTPDQPLLDSNAVRSPFGDYGRTSSASLTTDSDQQQQHHRRRSSTSDSDLTSFARGWNQHQRSYQILALELGITNTQYGALQSSVSAVNTVLPILGGLFIDSFGTTTGSLMATFLIMFGNLIISLSTHSRSFPVMVVGRIFYGLGSGTITVVQETILGSWFKGKGLALTIAIQITTSRIASFLSMGTAIPISDRFGFYGAAFWANFVVCAISFAINILYMLAMRRIRRGTPETMLSRLRSKHRFNPRLVLFFFGIYWMFIVESFTLGGGWNSFLHINSELVKLRFGVNDSVAAWSASASQIMPIFLVPFLGWFFDQYGMRTDMLVLSTSLFTISIALLGFTMLTPIVGLVIFSISLALGPLAEITAISLILPSSSLGTGLGIYKSAMNIGSTIVDIVVGVLQDRGSRLMEDTEHSYDYVMAFFMVWGIISTVVATTIFFVDRRKWHSLLRSSAQDRSEAYHLAKDKINRPMIYVSSPNWREYVQMWNYMPLAMLTLLLVVSLVLFAYKLV